MQCKSFIQNDHLDMNPEFQICFEYTDGYRSSETSVHYRMFHAVIFVLFWFKSRFRKIEQYHKYYLVDIEYQY